VEEGEQARKQVADCLAAEQRRGLLIHLSCGAAVSAVVAQHGKEHGKGALFETLLHELHEGFGAR